MADIDAMRAEIENFLDDLEVREPIRPDEISVDDFAERRGINRVSARRILIDQIKAGKMTRREATKDGRPLYAYSLVKK